MTLPGVMLDGMMLSSGAEATLSPLMIEAPPPGTVGARGSDAAESRWDITKALLETRPRWPEMRANGLRRRDLPCPDARVPAVKSSMAPKQRTPPRAWSGV